MKKDISSAPIGVFDSGIGGLSIAEHISQQLPNENLIYVADSQHTPYGEKSADLIVERVNFISQQLIAQGAKAIVIACNTATVHAITHLRILLSNQLGDYKKVPIIGVEPAIKPAVKYSKTKKIAILVTQATYQNQNFHDLVNLHRNDAQVFIQSCPGLVEIIEQGQQGSIYCNQLLSTYLKPLIHQGIDTLVLGCTHYPFLQAQISEIVGANINVIDTAAPVTSQLIAKLTELNLLTKKYQQGQIQFFSSQPNKQQELFIGSLWQTKVTLLPFSSAAIHD